jgi:hypothetical protein
MIKISSRKNAAKASIELACFRLEVEYLTNYTMAASFLRGNFVVLILS